VKAEKSQKEKYVMGEKMRKLVLICAEVLALFGLSGVASTVPPKGGMFPIGTYASITVTPGEVDLGAVPILGSVTAEVPAKLSAHIVANCPHYIAVSFDGFRRIRNGDSIPAENVSVAINGIKIPVNGRSIPIVNSPEPTPRDGVELPVDIEVGLRRGGNYQAGKYRGTLSFIVAAAP
jgi:hypothetical protein